MPAKGSKKVEAETPRLTNFLSRARCCSSASELRAGCAWQDSFRWAECRLSRVDLSSDEQEPIIDEFIRLLESKNIDVLDHHREGAAFSFGIFVPGVCG